MLKSHIKTWLFAATFIFSAWLNVVHAYEHDEHEQHSEECEICILLSKLSDLIQSDLDSSSIHLSVVENYLFIIKNNSGSTVYTVHPRAPPQVNIPR